MNKEVKSPIPTIDELLKMNDAQLAQHGYERTSSWVKKTVNNLVSVLDLSPIAILKRAGIDPTVESINAHFQIDGGKVKLVELDDKNPIYSNTTEDGDGNLIEIEGILSNWEGITIIIDIAYISKFPEDEESYGHVVPEYVKSTELRFVEWEIWPPLSLQKFQDENGEDMTEEDMHSSGSVHLISWKMFASKIYMGSTRRVMVEYI